MSKKSSILSNDWQVAGLMQGGGGAAVGGGAFSFVMKSERAKFCGIFTFLGAGLAVGGSSGGASAPNLLTGGLNWSPLKGYQDRHFSADNIDGCAGRLSTMGASLGAGLGVVAITAFGWGGFVFNSQDSLGISFGGGAAAMTLVGRWDLATETVMYR
ncbi:MAG: hypothetical protein JXQ91_12030 [Vannielia sp.]|uniref:hypothetical protein n=1 Tax=Rhodobacterales TaxID=204455 RepID=UPI002095B46B|nr:hypothetical protein [Oceanicola sp. 502str15]MCO6383853.1 hypothetical protein [Oceanicola sp. 502str15]